MTHEKGNETGTTNQKHSPVFIVQVITSSPNQMLGSQKVSDTQTLVDYKFGEETRKKISAIRMRYKKPIYDTALDFHGLHLCTLEQQREFLDGTKEAEKELQEIDPSLHSSIIFIPIDVYDVAKGELYGQVISAIRYRILSEVIDRIKDKSGQLTKQSKEAMQRMIQRLKSVNVMNDPDIDKSLEDIYQKILTEDVEVVRKDLIEELKITQSRIGYIQL